jgi:hypothetical protein
MGDPVAAAQHVHESLRQDGTWMVVEPRAGDNVEDNLNLVGRLYYAISMMICTPASLAQDGRMALGTQAGNARLEEVIRAGGFSRVRKLGDPVQRRSRGATLAVMAASSTRPVAGSVDEPAPIYVLGRSAATGVSSATYPPRVGGRTPDAQQGKPAPA